MIKIITPCSRENNLILLFNSINFSCDWYIVFDKTHDEAISIIDRDEFSFLDKPWIHVKYTKGGVSGNKQRNLALEEISNGWLYFLDDDNLVHPDFFKVADEIISNNNKLKCIFFSQVKNEKGEIRGVEPNHVRVNFIDQAQFLIERSLIGELRYEQKYEADGIFIQNIFRNNDPGLFCFHNNPVVTYYNRLNYK